MCIRDSFSYDQRIDYSILKSNLLLSEMDVENNKRGYYPTVAAFAGYGYNTGRNKFSQLFTSPWFNNSNIGLSVNIPVFDGFAKKYKIQQAKFTVDKVKPVSYTHLDVYKRQLMGFGA